MVVQAGAQDGETRLALRLEEAYYALTRQTARHFSREGRGWRLTGVAGLDAPTMNRAVVDAAPEGEIPRLLDEAADFFGERDTSWSVVLATFRDTGRWHPELVARGLGLTTTLEVMVRPPGLDAPVETPRIRRAAPDETPRFTDLLMDVFRMPRRYYPALLDMTDAWRKAGARLYFGLDDGGEPVATTLVATVDGVAGIYNVGTQRHARRRGIAKELMARALQDCADEGADVVTLQVSPDGFAALFYLDLGFTPLYSWRFYTPRPRGLFG